MDHSFLLSLLIATPLVGALLTWLVAKGRWARWLALGFSLVELGLALGVVWGVAPEDEAFQLVEKHLWMPSINSYYHLGVDGLSALFLPMTAFLSVMMILSGWNVTNRVMPALYFALLLMLEGVTMGIFCALDTLLFFLFWELTIIPIYFLVSLWGIGPNRRHAATKYVLSMLAGGAPLLFGLLLAALYHQPVARFDLTFLIHNPLPVSWQWPIFFLLLMGFGVKIPLVPLHAWLPTLAMEGPVSITAMMTGLKLGAYGLIRFVLPLAPDVAYEMQGVMVGLGVVGILYGALAALAQSNLRKMLAFASISHVGLVVLGIFSFTLQGIEGALYQLLNFSLTSGGLYLLAGFIHQRLGSTDRMHMGGLAHPMPLASAFFLLLGIASLGMPLTSGFPGELLLLLGVLQTHIGAGLAALGGVVLGAAYFFGFYRQAFLGPLGSSLSTPIPALLPRELVVLFGFVFLILLGGWYPSLVLDFIHLPAQNWLGHFVGG